MRKFGRETGQRRAFKKGLAANLILKEKIKTTEARGKEIRSLVERLITYAKKGTLAGARQAGRFLPPKALQKLVKELAPRFKDRKGGYTRLTKLGRRMTDGAPVVFIELIKD